MSEPARPLIIYLATCHPAGKSYVGLTKQRVKKRWSRHVADARTWRRTCPALGGAIREFGKEAFSVEVIATALSDADLPALERALIAQHQTRWPNGYNLTNGGEGGVGRRWTEEQSAEASARWIEFYADPAQRARNGAVHRGKIVSEETRAKMRAKKLGGSRPPEACRKTAESLSQYLRDHPRAPMVITEEHRANLREAARLRQSLPSEEWEQHKKDGASRRADRRRQKQLALRQSPIAQGDASCTSP